MCFASWYIQHIRVTETRIVSILIFKLTSRCRFLPLLTIESKPFHILFNSKLCARPTLERLKTSIFVLH